MVNLKQRALLGALLGDAAGVPYEFKRPDELPDRPNIDMTPPAVDMLGRRFFRTYGMPDGTYSDDGALLLCLTEAMLDLPVDWPRAFAGKAVNWRRHGYMAVGGRVFDIGNQTAIALTELEEGADPTTREDDDWASGNGSLMRGLAPALTANDLTEAVFNGSLQSRATHATEDCERTCGVYAALAYLCLQGTPFEQALETSLQFAHQKLKTYENTEVSGKGWVIDSFWSAVYALRQGKDFRSTIQHAISLGDDTDTTACIAGGIAGILYELPEDWIAKMRGKELYEPIMERL